MSLEEVQHNICPVHALSTGDVFKQSDRFFMVIEVAPSGWLLSLDLDGLANKQIPHLLIINPEDDEWQDVSFSIYSLMSIDIKIRKEGG